MYGKAAAGGSLAGTGLMFGWKAVAAASLIWPAARSCGYCRDAAPPDPHAL